MNLRSVLTFNNVVFSLKTFAAAMLAYWIALCFDLPKPFWAVGTVYIVAHPLSGAITSKAIYRLIGTVIGGVMTVVLIPNLVNAPVLLTAAVALWVGLCLFVSLLDRTPRSYVSLLAGYTVLLAGLPLVNTPEAVFDTAVSRVEEIGLAIICAALVSRLVLPNHAGPVLLARVDAWLATVTRIAGDALNGRLKAEGTIAEWQCLAADAIDMRAFTTHVSYDTSHHRELTGLMRGLHQRKLALLPVISSLADLRTALAKNETPQSAATLDLLGEVGAWMESGRTTTSRSTGAQLREKAQALEAENAGNSSWNGLIQTNAARRVRELIETWEDCQTLRSDIAFERVSSTSERIIAQAGKQPQHFDYGMAALTAFAAMLCILVATVFWIETGWADGVTVAQISGVFCCLLATMDDPVPAMRKFLPVVVWAAIAAFIYNFGIMPMLDGFVPLVAALGLFLIPAGICLAVPSLFLIGMGLCVNLPFMIGLQSRLSTDFTVFINSNIATVAAVLWAMIVSSLVKSVGAETGGRRLLRAGWRRVYEIAARPAADVHWMRDRMLDALGLLAPRVAAVSADSDIRAGDLLRDLRIGLDLARLRDLRTALPPPQENDIAALMSSAATFYDGKSRGQWPAPDGLIDKVDHCLSSLSDAAGRASNETRAVLVAMRLCLAPRDEPPLPALPGSNAYRNAA